MSVNKDKTNRYVTNIIQDIQNTFVSERTIKFSETQIERVYEFEDGAVVKYEWQDYPPTGNDKDKYNHRFTLVTPPEPNPGKLEKGVIKVINYTTNSR